LRFIRTSVYFLAGGLFFLTAPSVPLARANPLSSEECTALRQQMRGLEAKGIAKRIAKGAQWAAENLDASQISEVGVFLNLLEQINFRCGNFVARSRKKTAIPRIVPLPVRNSRRLIKQVMEKSSVVSSETATAGNVEKKTSETDAVISAVTGKDEAVKKQKDPKMRKTLEE
jgi:hypothetical protein